MAAKRHERTYARKQAIQMLYQAEILGRAPAELLGEEGGLVDGAKPSRYASLLVAGVGERMRAIDALLGECSENWAVGRMPVVDRAILRLASFEMAYVDGVPVSVAINEAVELAKEYGGEDDSPRFVNGVLGRIADYLEEHDGTVPEPPGEAGPASGDAAPSPDGGYGFSYEDYLSDEDEFLFLDWEEDDA